MTKITRETKQRAPERAKRVPVSGSRNILTVDNLDPSYNYRWVNDTDGRIKRFTSGGYEHVNDDVAVGDKTVDSAKGAASVISKDVGAGVTAYLMRIKREWYEEDKAAKQRKVDEQEESMKRQVNGIEGGYGNVTVK